MAGAGDNGDTRKYDRGPARAGERTTSDGFVPVAPLVSGPEHGVAARRPSIAVVTTLDTERTRVQTTFQRLHNNLELRLSLLEAQAQKEMVDGTGNGSYVLSKADIEMLDLYMKSANTIAKMQDVANRAVKMLGKHVTQERIDHMFERMQTLMFGDMDNVVFKEMADDVKDEVERLDKHLKARTNRVEFSRRMTKAAKQSVMRFRNKLVVAFKTGQFLSSDQLGGNQ